MISTMYYIVANIINCCNHGLPSLNSEAQVDFQENIQCCKIKSIGRDEYIFSYKWIFPLTQNKFCFFRFNFTIYIWGIHIHTCMYLH